MKKIIAIFAGGLFMLLMAGVASAQCAPANPYLQPRAPAIDCGVRIGGNFPSMSFYFTGLRAGTVDYPLQTYGLRNQFSSYYYPREFVGGNPGYRSYTYRPGQFRQNSAFLGDHVFFGGNTRYGSYGSNGYRGNYGYNRYGPGFYG